MSPDPTSPNDGRRPRLLLDVDGVINALERPVHCRWVLVRGYPIYVPEGTVGRLRRLVEPFDPIWATSWERHAATRISPLIEGIGAGWDHIEFPYLGNDPRVRNTWKLEGILAWADRPENAATPLVWLDDDLDEDAEEWANDRTAAGVTTGLVQTDGALGLTDDDVARALAFAG